MRVLVVNAGSTSVKLRLVDDGDRFDGRADLGVGGRADLGAGGRADLGVEGRADLGVEGSADLGPPGAGLEGDLDDFLASAGRVDAVGHRVVHGGERFQRPVLVDDAVRSELDRLSELAPLHNPPALAAMDALRAAAPGLPAVACFDTAFHAGLPEEARRYALPADWVERWGIRRYGFHGLSCEWALGRASAMLGREPSSLRLIVCHLGGGASVTAIAGGRSVDTTMGFTPTEGLVMATRSGDVDPGAIAFLAERGLTGAELMDGLEHRSGLLGLTGGRTGDMKELIGAREAGDAVAAAAVAVYVHRLRAEIAAMTASAGGADAVVFTGGVGERAAAIREEAARGLGWMGLKVDPAANEAVGRSAVGRSAVGRSAVGRSAVGRSAVGSGAVGSGAVGSGAVGSGADGSGAVGSRTVGSGVGEEPDGWADTDISASGAAVRALVIRAREEVVVADHCREVIGAAGSPRAR